MKATTQDYAIGQELLRKAVTRENAASRCYGQYTDWVSQHNVPLEVITIQLIEAKGWSQQAARKAATSVKRSAIACMRFNQSNSSQFDPNNEYRS